jgi:very-short-patch-repair endonuclease
MPNKSANRARDAAIARVAARQHGVITRRQLLAVGLFPSGVSDRVKAGRLHRIHRGVYAVGHYRLSNEGRWIAAVLACGEDAVLSHRSAAQLWRMLPAWRGTDTENDQTIHVTVTGEGRHRPGVRVHRTSTLSPDDTTIRHSIPVTNPARTLEDLRRTCPRQVFASALRQAEFLALPIRDRWRPDRTRSELERRFLTLLRRHRLPKPEVNVRAGGFVVDFLWRGEHLISELDGWATHRTRSAFEADRSRDNQLRVLGFQVVRFTWRQVSEESAEVAGTIRSLLTATW